MFFNRTRWAMGLAFSAAALTWMGLIFYLSSLSALEVSKPLESNAISWMGELRSYVAHAVLYGILASLVLMSLWGWNLTINLRLAIAAAAFSCLFGISDEIHQSFVTGRSATVTDAVVDSMAATLVAALLWLAAANTGRLPMLGAGPTSLVDAETDG